MRIRMRSLAITSYRDCDKRKFKFAQDLKEDTNIRKFLYTNIDKSLFESHDLEDLKYGESYIIADKDKLIGYIRIADFDKLSKAIELHYAVHPDYRSKGYGTKILNEVSEYILDTFINVETIDLYISENNKESIKCAEKTGFEFVEKYVVANSEPTFIYRKHK